MLSSGLSRTCSSIGSPIGARDGADLCPEMTHQSSSLPGLTNLAIHGKKSFGAEEAYELEEILGEGGYGCVHRCHRSRDGATYAVKIIDPVRLGFVGGEHAIKKAETMAVKEVNALRQLTAHPGIISLEAAFYSIATRHIYIVTDHVPGGHLFSHVVSRATPLHEEEVSHVVAQISDALRFCHSLGLVHRDLKLENVLVADIDVTLQQTKEPDTGLTLWQTREVFSVKICDFGFAKSLEQFTTRTPIGTASYAAPEVNLVSNEKMRAGFQDLEVEYDAFKADAYSVGLMIFVMLCLAFPDKDGSHRSHKLWPTLSSSAQSLVDGLLDLDPIKRFSLINVCQHTWVNFMKVDPHDQTKPKPSKPHVADEVGPDFFERMDSVSDDFLNRDTDLLKQTTVGIPRCVDDPVLQGVLALHRALIHIQQERSMALWALAGSPSGVAGMSCSRDQLQWHIELTEKRIREAKNLLAQGHSADERAHLTKTFEQLASSLRAGRQLSLSVVPLDTTDRPSGCLSLDSFDSAFAAYNDACRSIVEKVVQRVKSVKPESPEGRRAARQYRLFSSAAEQLSRERAFMSGQSQSHSAGSFGAKEVSSAMMQRLFEIRGARKILLGTANKGSYTVTTSTGLLGTLIGEGQPSLLSTADVAELEYLEERLLAPTKDESLPIAEWYRTLTRLLNEIHTKISISLAHDIRTLQSESRIGGIRAPSFFLETRPLAGPSNLKYTKTLGTSGKSAPVKKFSGEPRRELCGCKAGLRLVLLRLLDLVER